MINIIKYMRFNAWDHKTGVSVLPYLNISYYKSQGNTSIGCLKYHVTMGWLFNSISFSWYHKGWKLKK